MNKDVKYVGIRKDLFNEIEEYAKLNGFKTTWLINDLLKKRFMVEKYGDSPFDMFAKRVEIMETPPEIQAVINDNFWEMMEDDKPKQDECAPVDKELVDKMLNEVDEIMAIPADRLVPQTPESQAIIDEHNRLLKEKNDKARNKRRLK